MPKKFIIEDSRGNAYTAEDLAKIGKRSRTTVCRQMKRVLEGELTADVLISKLKKNKEFIPNSRDYLVFIGAKDEETDERPEYTVESVMKATTVTRETAARRIRRALKDPSRESEILIPAKIGTGVIDRTPLDLTEEQIPIWAEIKKITDSCREIHDKYYEPIDYEKARRITMNTKRR